MTMKDCSGLQVIAQNKKEVFFVGRGIDHAVCLEGSLKLEEISYIHSEAYVAGELKYGRAKAVKRICVQ